MKRKGPNGKYLPKTDDCPIDDVPLSAIGIANHRELINYMRAENHKTWIKNRHMKKYLAERHEIEALEQRLLSYAY